MPRRRRNLLPIALLLSFVLHALAVALLPIATGDAVVTERPIEVSLIQPPAADLAARAAEAPPPRPRQMVAPPDEINDRPPERPRFESDRDNTVLKETVKPGVPNPAPPAQPKRAAPSKPARASSGDSDDDEPPPREAAKRPSRAPGLDDLFASTDELVEATRGAGERVAQEARQKQAAEESGSGRRRLALAVPPVAPEWSLPGTRGTFDHLPDIQRGNVTLLNTKANVFAPFVRRVGERVFQHLIIRQRRLELEQIMSARAPVQMRVILDRRGKLKSVRVDNQSGSVTMDDTLSDAVQTAAFDNNPPVAAANGSGEFEFVFQAQLRAFEPGAGGQPSRIESRLSVALM